MVANNIGHAEDSNRSGKFHGSFTQSSTEPQIQPNLFERMNNCNELSPRIFAAQNEVSLEISSCINAIKEYVAESSSRSKQYMPRKFAEMSLKFSFRSRICRKAGNFVKFRRQVFALLLHNTVKFPSYFSNRNTSFIKKIKPFSKLTDILLPELCKTSDGYWY